MYNLGKLLRQTPLWAWVVGVIVVGIEAARLASPVGDSRTSAPVGSGHTSAESAPSTLGAIGATDAYWDARHEPDPNFAPGSAYDPDPSLVPPGGDKRFSARYYLVHHSGGRVQSYGMRFAPGTSIDEAKADTLAEFPHDTKVDWFRTVPASGSAGACAQMHVSSATLAREFPGEGPTAGLVEFSSGEAANSYNPDAVSTAFLMLLPPTAPSKAIGCKRVETLLLGLLRTPAGPGRAGQLTT